VAWNCDDDWRWEEVGAPRAELFTHMVTTYRHVLEAHRQEHPNLLLSQWGCTGLGDGRDVTKDLPFSFVGSCYGPRVAQIAALRRRLGLRAFGKGVRASGGPLHRRARRLVARLLRIPWYEDDLTLPDQNAVKGVWNRSRISFTPLDSGPASTLQVKARVFDMGLSGTLMLAPAHEALHEWYEPGKEYVEFEDLDDCMEKARWYLAHEEERRAIAEAYRRRTVAEHLWTHRYAALFHDLET
jgi:spore maturation protein CgeB